jgi:hypothetical protein
MAVNSIPICSSSFFRCGEAEARIMDIILDTYLL